MPVEPEKIIYRFPRRAERWRRTLSYGGAECRPGEEIAAVHYRFRAETPAAVGRRIAFFSDLHHRGDPEQWGRLEEAVQLMTEFKPDILMAGGDMAAYAADLGALPEALAAFRTVAPVRLAVLGNWENNKIWIDHGAYWRKLFADSGFRLLENECHDDGVFRVYGAGDIPVGRVRIPPWPEEPRERLLLAHNPDTVICFDSGNDAGLPPLSITGHTHGGQIRLPLVGALYSSSVYGRKFDYGVYTRYPGGNKMIVSSGLENCSFPLRFNCRREVVLITMI